MTMVIQLVVGKDRIRVVDHEKLLKWKKSLVEGQVFDAIFDDGSSTALTPLAKRYFATRDEYAGLNGYTTQSAHEELKHFFGMCYPPDSPPVGRTVRLVPYHGEMEWQLSVTDMDHDELSRLTEGATLAVAEAGI